MLWLPDAQERVAMWEVWHVLSSTPSGFAARDCVGGGTLLSSSGAEAYWIARRRAEEASSEEMTVDWSGVADAIARKTGKRLWSVIAATFQ
jgi:hypothetical protein